MPFVSSALGRFVYLGSTIPLKVTNLIFSNITNTGFQVEWTGGFGATSYVYTINGTITTPYVDQGVLSKYAIFTGLSSLVNYVINITPKNASGTTSSAFTPASIPGLKLWLDANDPYNNGGSSKPANASNMGNWSDKSGNGYTAIKVNTGGTESVFYTNVQNGLPGIYMNSGGNGYSSFYSNSIPTGTFNSEFDIFIVYNYVPDQPVDKIFSPTLFSKSQSGSSAPNCYLILESGRFYNIFGQQVSSSPNTGPYFSSYNPVILNMNVSQASQATSQLTGYVNGGQFIMNGTTSGWSPFTDNGANIQIGSRSDGGGAYPLYVYEVLIYNVQVSVENRQKIEGYLAWKWGLNNSLSPIHPYYLYTPLANVTTTSIAPFSIVFSNVTSTSFQVNWSGGATATSYIYMLNGIVTTPTIDMGVASKYAIFTELSECSVYSVIISANNYGASGLNSAVPPLPGSITGLKNWYDASDPLGSGVAPSTGTNISTWYDKSGNKSNATLTTGGISGNSGLSGGTIMLSNDGYNYLTFNSAYYSLPALTWATTNPASVFIIFSVSSSQTTSLISSSASNCIKIEANSSTSLTIQYGSVRPSDTTYTMTNKLLLSYIFTSSYTLTGYINGTQTATTTGSAYPTGTANYIGYNGYWGAGGLKMREILIYQGTLNTTDRQNVEGYLAQKWGLALSLPSNHPYYNVSMNYPSAEPFMPSSPTSASMQIWYDASDPINNGTGNQPTLGNNLASWYDKSANVFNATAGVAAQLRRDSRYYLDCSGGYYTMPSGSMNWALNTDFTLFIVETMIRFTSTSTGNSFFGSVSGNKFNLAYTLNNSHPSLSITNNNSTGHSAKSTALGNTRIWTFSLVSATNNTFVYLNGNLMQIYGGYQINEYVGPTIAAANGNYSNGNTYLGRYRELIGYKGTINKSDRQQVEGYLAQKWSTQNSLPLSHPYYSVKATSIAVTSIFSPLYVEGLQDWFDAADPLNTRSPPNLNTNITTWYDRSGYQNNAVGNATVRLQNDAYYYLSYPTSDSNASPIIPNLTWSLNTYFTIFLVDTMTGYGNGSTLLSTVNTTNGGFVLGYNASGQMQFYVTPDQYGACQVFYPTTNTIGLTTNVTRLWSFTFSAVPSNYTLSIYINGEIGASTTGRGFLNSTSGGITGNLGFYGGSSYKGRLRELLLYKGDMMKSDRQSVEGYLAWKWGLQASLTTAHPYYSAPPVGSKNVASSAITNLALDISSNDTGSIPQNVTIGGPATTFTRIAGKACAFFNKGNYLNYNFTPGNSSTSFTIAYWVYVIDTGQYTPWTIGTNINGSGTYGINPNMSTDISGIQHIYFNTVYGGYDGSFALPIQCGVWYFITIVVTQTTGRTSTYLNGQYLSFTNMGPSVTNLNYLTLGCGSSGGLNSDTTRREFYGYLRNFMVFSYDLSISDINILYNQTNTFLGATSASTYLPLSTNSTDIGISPQTVTINGTITYTNIGNKACAYFNNSTSNYLSIPFTSSKVFTIAYWFYAADYGYYDPWSLSSTATGTAYGINPDINAGTQNFNLTYSGGVVDAGNYSYLVSSGAWYFVTLVVNNTNSKSYVNGRLLKSAVGSGNLLNRSYLLLGKAGNNSRAFNGYLKNFMVFNSELAPADILTLYNQMSTPTTTPITLTYAPNENIFITSITSAESIFIKSTNIITRQYIDVGSQTIIFNANNSGSGLISGLPDFNYLIAIWITSNVSSLHLGVMGYSGAYYVYLPASPTAPGGYSISSSINTQAQFGSAIESLVALSDTKVYALLNNGYLILILNGTATNVVLSGGSIVNSGDMVHGGVTLTGLDILYVTDRYQNLIKQIIVTSSTTANITTIIGGGTSVPSSINTYGTSVQLNYPLSLSYYAPLNILFFTDVNNVGGQGNTQNAIVRIYMPNASNGIGQVTTINGIMIGGQNLGVDENLGVLYVAIGSIVYRYLISSLLTDRGYIPISIITTYLSAVTLSTSGISIVSSSVGSLAVDSSNNLYLGRDGNYVYKINSSYVVSQFGYLPSLSGQKYWGVTFANNSIYIMDLTNGLLKLNSSGGLLATYAVTGWSCFTDGNGNVYAVNGANGVITKVDSSGNISTAVSSATLSTLNGGDGPGQSPYGAIDSLGNFYIADQSYKKVIKVTGGVPSYMSTIFNVDGLSLGQMGIDSYGNLFVVCGNGTTSTYQIQFINTKNGQIVYTYTDANPIIGAAVDSDGTIWFTANNVLKKLPTH